jgi:hypothetical protein
MGFLDDKVFLFHVQFEEIEEFANIGQVLQAHSNPEGAF